MDLCLIKLMNIPELGWAKKQWIECATEMQESNLNEIRENKLVHSGNLLDDQFYNYTYFILFFFLFFVFL